MIQNRPRLPRKVPRKDPEAISRSVIASKREVGVHADVGVGESPALPALIQKDHPQEIMFLRVV
jgi:hypothetical protein